VFVILPLMVIFALSKKVASSQVSISLKKDALELFSLNFSLAVFSASISKSLMLACSIILALQSS
jgi:hypothetical protein